MNALGAVALPLSLVVLLIFGGIALYYARDLQRTENDDTEFFLTARNTQTTAHIAWTFYSSTVGAWVLFVPAGYATDHTYGGGWFGLICYAIFAGAPILLVAWLGSKLRHRYPKALSIGDFARWRFGFLMEIYVTLLVVFYVGLALCVEYTTIGGLFSQFFGINRIVPILACFIITMTYTSIGGVYVSIVTDQWQARFSLLVSFLTVIYISATFRPASLPPLPDYLALNETGLGSIATLGISFASTGIFNDAYWQRVWSSENDKALQWGAIASYIMVTIVVFIFGLGGFLATWAGMAADPDTSFFALLSSDSWMLILTTLLAVAMNESLVDSYQNALTDCAVSLAMSCGLTIPVNAARLITVIMNVPVVLIGLQGYKANSLFLVACIITTTSCIPIILGLFPSLDKFVHQSTALFSCAFSITSIMIYGHTQTGSFVDGIQYCFWEAWRWQVFLLAFFGCGLGILLFIGVETLLRWMLSRPWPPFVPHVIQDAVKERELETKDSQLTSFLTLDKDSVIPLQRVLTTIEP